MILIVSIYAVHVDTASGNVVLFRDPTVKSDVNLHNNFPLFE